MKSLYKSPQMKTPVLVIVLNPTHDKTKVWIQLENGQAIRVSQSDLEAAR